MSKVIMKHKVEVKQENKNSTILGNRVGQSRDNSALNSLANENAVRTKNSSITIKEIPIDLIKERDVNNFIISDIQSMAESIEKIGIQQPIIVRVNRDIEEEGYICVAGHRRLAAIKYLREKYMEQFNDNDNNMVLLYSYIRARILSRDEEENEEEIYNDTNFQSRNLTVFEKLLAMDVKAIHMDNEEIQEDYIDLLLKGNPQAKVGNIKFNQNAKYEYLLMKLEQRFGSTDVGISTIKKYTLIVESSTPELIKAILSGKIPLIKVGNIYNKEAEMQHKLIEAYGTDEFDNIINATKAITEEETEESVMDYQSFINKAVTQFKSLNALIENINNIPKNELNANQKECLKQMKKVHSAYEKFYELPKK